MRFLIDAQLPPALAAWLVNRGFEAKAVRELGLRDAPDSAIWGAAQDAEWIVVSKDEDFVEWALRAEDAPRIVWLRIGNCTNPTLFAWLEPLWPSVVRLLDAGHPIVEVRRSLTE